MPCVSWSCVFAHACYTLATFVNMVQHSLWSCCSLTLIVPGQVSSRQPDVCATSRRVFKLHLPEHIVSWDVLLMLVLAAVRLCDHHDLAQLHRICMCDTIHSLGIPHNTAKSRQVFSLHEDSALCCGSILRVCIVVYRCYFRACPCKYAYTHTLCAHICTCTFCMHMHNIVKTNITYTQNVYNILVSKCPCDTCALADRIVEPGSQL